ncbi:MAG: hypothetical protein AAF962_08855 [Actinomycetota bacterium]
MSDRPTIDVALAVRSVAEGMPIGDVLDLVRPGDRDEVLVLLLVRSTSLAKTRAVCAHLRPGERSRILETADRRRTAAEAAERRSTWENAPLFDQEVPY